MFPQHLYSCQFYLAAGSPASKQVKGQLALKEIPLFLTSGLGEGQLLWQPLADWGRRGALSLAQLRRPVAGSRGRVGCRGPASREQQFSVKGKLGLVLSKRSIWRGQHSEGGEWRPAMRSPAFIYNLSFCRKKGSKAGGSCPDRRGPCPARVLLCPGPQPAHRAPTWCRLSDRPLGSVRPPAAPSTESGASCAEAGGARRGREVYSRQSCPQAPTC